MSASLEASLEAVELGQEEDIFIVNSVSSLSEKEVTTLYLKTSSNARLCPGNSLITQIIDLQTLFAINDRQTGQTDRQTDRSPL